MAWNDHIDEVLIGLDARPRTVKAIADEMFQKHGIQLVETQICLHHLSKDGLAFWSTGDHGTLWQLTTLGCDRKRFMIAQTTPRSATACA